MNHPVHRSLKAAYSFYNVHTTTPLLDLMSDALILAKSVHVQSFKNMFSEMFTFKNLIIFPVSLFRKGLMSLMHWI